MDILSRQIPFNLEAEQSVLGSIIVDPQKYDTVAESGLKVTDFYLDEHKEIFTAMQKLYLSSRNIDLVTLIDTLVASGVYDRERSMAYIKTIASIVPSASNIHDYIKIVKDKSLKRTIIKVCEESCDLAYSDSDGAEDVLDAVAGKIYGLTDNVVRRDFEHIRDVLVETYAQIKKAGSDDADSKGVPTGFSGLDNVLVGMGSGDLVLVGARPGMGKTAFALNLAVNGARSTKKAVCIFSLEMSSPQLVMRMLASEAMVNSYSLRSGNLTNEDWKKLAAASSYLAECDIYIDDTPGMSVSSMRAKLRRIKNIGLVVIDYLQLMQSDKKTDNRVNEVGDISRNLKLLAKELGVPVICCAQLSRGPESREDKRPMLSDLRDSGAIEQDADSVMFLFRDEYYKKEQSDKQDEAEVIIAKNRHGSLGNVKLGWYGEFTKFATKSDREEE